MLITVGVSGVAMTSLTQPSSASNKVPLSQMAGKWTGNGWETRSNGGAKERVRCRLTAKYTGNSRKLSLSGKCAATGGTYTLLGHIAEYPGTDKLTGRWVNPKGIGASNLKGKRSANQLRFVFEGKDGKTKRKVQYQTVWHLRQNGFSLSTGLASGNNNSLGQINFVK